MARNKPEVFVSNEYQGVYEDACRAVGVFAVLYDGKPFTLRYQRTNDKVGKYMYKTTVYTHPGNAHRLAKQLNEKYDTGLFTVESFYDKE